MSLSAKRSKVELPLEELAGSDALENLQQLRVLVIGAGGLGCEILKNLVCSGFTQIDIIDMDVIELTNLNRQFLFRPEDIGKPKSEVAVRRIQSYDPEHSEITAHFASIESMPDSFYQKFHIVVCGLDSIRARRWINAKIVDLCFQDPSPSGLRPLIDGGSEGLRGQCRVILPGITPCYECTLDLHDNTKTYPLCTIASIPRLPEHCVEWARIIRWPQVHGQDKLPNYDSLDDIQWLYKQALQRAAEFKIRGVDLDLVYGTLKRIIPAIASTNSIIAAACSLEALKLAIGYDSPGKGNYFMYSGLSGAYMAALGLERRNDCPVCGSNIEAIDTRGNLLLVDFLKQVAKTLLCDTTTLPSISSAEGKTIYMHSPVKLREMTEHNLKLQVRDLFKSGDEAAISHPDLRVSARVVINYY